MSEEKQFKSFIELMKEIDIQPHEQRDRGTLFEYLVKAYLSHEPMYKHLFTEVWLLKDVPEVYGISKKDTGVDLVALNRDTHTLTAIQAKYYDHETTIYKRHIDSFFNELGKTQYENGIIISSTDNWSDNANEALEGRDKPISRIGLSQLKDSKIDWSKFSFNQPESVALNPTKTPRPHQKEAIENVISAFETEPRGKLIMAPGTGKTYTSLIIAEKLAERKKDVFRVLYLVPSIQLLSQSIRGWSGDTKLKMSTIAVCSDRKVTKIKGNNDIEDIAATDIGYPATTDYKKLLDYQLLINKAEDTSDFVVIFSTYQSIDVINRAQDEGFYNFDLIIADEAHRTTGATEQGKEKSAFVKVHEDKYVKSVKRLYQTATPRVYGESAHQKAEEMSTVVADMNDENIYGKELYRLGFGEAVNKGILTDYKVMVLAVEEEAVQTQMQQMFARDENELKFNDVAKIIGCWNGLLKRKSHSNNLYGPPMKRAIAFTGTIAHSKNITNQFTTVINEYLDDKDEVYETFKVEIEHADGSMNALQKNAKIDWLRSEVPDNTCRILSNARFLTEGVDIPNLDAVMFLQPRKSTIDIAQAVGRVMRKAPNKDYGYVILPIGIPNGKNANEVLDNHETYKIVWEVLNALRSIDERFDAMVNKIELNKKKPKLVEVIGVGNAPEVDKNDGKFIVDNNEQLSLDFDEEDWSELERVIYAKIVQKVGNTRYWESWSKDVSDLAQQHIMRINATLESEPATTKLFNEFLSSLRHNINTSITKDDAIEMLAQHAITKPVFDVLFEEESFALENPVSKAMNMMVQQLENLGFNKEQEALEGFYESVRIRAAGIDNLEAKQTIIVQLYEKFFKEGFPETTDSLGIVFTPIEVVDFIIHSVNDALENSLGKTLSDENINVLDPFTGTGTFITRLIQSDLIRKEDLLRKYSQEIYANEIVLLSYYIAAINIEETFKEIKETNEYIPFNGIVLTDTFETTEKEATLDDNMFGENNERLNRQKKSPITVIIGNPPYSVGARDENMSTKNVKHDKLNQSIANTYAKGSNSTSLRSLYDSYVKAFRWATDRVEDQGIISFITNSSFIDGSSMDGVRKLWQEEFNKIYVINLRGAIRQKIGDEAKKEGGNVFDIMTGVAITILIKDGSNNHDIYYFDIGDYKTKDEKLKFLKETKSIKNVEWEKIQPDENNDWINKKDNNYQNFPKMLGDVFYEKHDGIQTNRDAWVFNYSREKTLNNSNQMIINYNSEVHRLTELKTNTILDDINTDSRYISWSRALKNKVKKLKKIDISKNNIVLSSYRPFTKKFLNYNLDILELPRKYNKVFFEKNLLISITGNSAKRDFSALMINTIPEFKFMENGKHFNLYTYEDIFGEMIKQNNIVDKLLNNTGMSKKDIFMYTYAILHSPEYKRKYNNDLRKDLPHIPLVKNYKEFIEKGYKLADLHLNYENVSPCSEIVLPPESEINTYKVTKMKFSKKKDLEGKNVNDKSTIIFNKDIKIKNIPNKAYEYMVNGRSAIEWIMDQYQIKTDKSSGIIDDPNEYSDDSKYIFNLLLSIINLSIQTVDLVESLPLLNLIEE